ncbi:MAG TPA: DUF4382 domain-containing protein [Candidatus Paceibacterota bacterium]|nr:DUF4382 domain-containing protein [Candidatus Paceibacterota bacterium]
MNRTTLGVLFLIIIIAIAGFFFIRWDHRQNEKTQQDLQGVLMVSVTDPSAHLENVSEIRLTLSKIEIHSKDKNWTTLSDKSQTFPLLALDQSKETRLYAEERLDPGEYDQVRATVSGVTVVSADGTETQAVLPSQEMTISGNIVVNKQATSTIKLSFSASQSLRKAVSGTYVFAPVVKMEARKDATTQVDQTTQTVQETDGSVTSETTVGMDVDGQSKLNFHLAPDIHLEIVNGAIQVLAGTDESSSTDGNAETNTESTTTNAADTNENATSTTSDAGVGINVNTEKDTAINNTAASIHAEIGGSGNPNLNVHVGGNTKAKTNLHANVNIGETGADIDAGISIKNPSGLKLNIHL